ncbi:MAG: DUF1800 domain-containing protein [Steroidobacteraceae bacterium]
MTNTEAVIAANRFGLGARPGELQQIQADPRGWLKAQVKGERALPAAIKSLPPSNVVFQEQIEALKEKRMAKKEAAEDENNTAAKPAAGIKRGAIVGNYVDQVAARYQIATRSAESFRERLVHFWTNHFAVSMDKNAVAAIAGTLENEAIRPNLHLSFYDLLLAADSHPAMILYLDNQASTGPNSQLAQLVKRRARQERKVDINENLGREILELHTLGVNGGYTQADVTTFAKVLTGWSVGGDQGARLGAAAKLNVGEAGKFAFREGLHEPGAQTLLGKRYSEDGINQPKAVLKDLSRHPATAQFVATKLVRHFIADEPPAAAVDRVAKAFRDSEGHLPTVHAAVVDSAEAWAQAQTKFKTPHEFVVSSFRALDYVPDKPQQVLAPFELLGQRPYSPGSPAGWADIAGQWDGPDALMKRIEWATQIGQRIGTRRSPLQLAEQSLGASFNDHTRMALNGAADAAQGVVLWLVSPEFQRR